MIRRTLIITCLIIISTVTLALSFTRDWDNTDPIDHTLNSQWPAEIREVMVDVEERLDDIMNGFTSGDTVTDFNVVPINNRASAPAAVAETYQIYSKDVSGVAELFGQDENGAEIQLTTGGSLNTSSQCSSVWPVGSIFIATVSTNPGTLLGCGTWTAFGAGRVLVGLDSGDTDFDTSEETGGAKTHTLTIDEMPAHTHNGYKSYNTTGSEDGSDGWRSGIQTKDSATSSTGGGSAHSIVQPYIVVYMWERAS